MSNWSDKSYAEKSAAVEAGLGKASLITGALGDMVSAFKENSAIKDNSAELANIKALGNATTDTGNLDSAVDNFAAASTNLSLPSYKASQYRASTGTQLFNTGKAALNGALTGSKVGGVYGAIAGAVVGLGSGISGMVKGNISAHAQARNTDTAREQAITRLNNNFNNSIYDIQSDSLNRNLRNIMAFGGDKYDMSFMNGMENPDALTTIDAGSSHEMNPYGGVPSGIAPDGQPNLVEEGEAIQGDFVFSDRLTPTQRELEQANLPKKFAGKTFADIAKALSEEADANPNDPISKRGKEVNLDRLATVQEQQKAAQQQAVMEAMQAFMPQQPQGYAFGGHKFAAGGPPVNLDNAFVAQSMGAVRNADGTYTVMDKDGGYTFRFDENGKIVPVSGSSVATATPAAATALPSLRSVSFPGDSLDTYTHPELIDTNLSDEDIASLDDESLAIARVLANNTGAQAIEDEDNLNRMAKARLDEFAAMPRFGEYEVPTNAPGTAFGKVEGSKPELAVSTSKRSSKTSQDTDDEYKSTWMRYAPAFGAALGALESAFQKPDYSDINRYVSAAYRSPYVNLSERPTGRYMQYRPVDENYLMNQTAATLAGNRRGVTSAGLNSGNVMSALMAQNLSSANAIAQARMQAGQQNLTNYNNTLQFNNAIDAANAQSGINVQNMNNQARMNAWSNQLNALQRAANEKAAIQSNLGQVRGNTTTNSFNQLGNVGRDNFFYNQAKSNGNPYTTGLDGLIRYLEGHQTSKGGMLTKRKKSR